MTEKVHSFRGMGTEVRLIADLTEDPSAFENAALRVEAIFAREGTRFSRFRHDSELSAVNSRAGSSMAVSPVFAELTQRALTWASSTDGLFDPTVLPALVAAGYDRDLDEVMAGARNAQHPAVPCGRWREIELLGLELYLPDGVGLDFGGIAKGWAVDLAARSAIEAGLGWALVNAGGDIRVAGTTREAEIAIEDPFDRSKELARIVITEGAVATSSTTRRTWGPGLHHLIDPRTGEPASTGVVQVTAWASTCEEAEVRAKTALMSGSKIDRALPGIWVGDSGQVLVNLDREAAA